MAAEKLGDARCPLCGGVARLSLSKNNYPVMTMDCCKAQLFSRGPDSDEHMRDRIINPAAKPAGDTPAAPVAAPKPAIAPIPSTPPVASPVAAPVPVPARKRSFGITW